jgi:hypothetical protein
LCYIKRGVGGTMQTLANILPSCTWVWPHYVSHYAPFVLEHAGELHFIALLRRLEEKNLLQLVSHITLRLFLIYMTTAYPCSLYWPLVTTIQHAVSSGKAPQELNRGWAILKMASFRCFQIIQVPRMTSELNLLVHDHRIASTFPASPFCKVQTPCYLVSCHIMHLLLYFYIINLVVF